MRTDVLDKLRQVEAMRRYVGQVDRAMEQLDPTGRLMLDILQDEHREKVLRIADALGVSQATAYRYVDALLGEIDNFLRENA